MIPTRPRVAGLVALAVLPAVKGGDGAIHAGCGNMP